MVLLDIPPRVWPFDFLTHFLFEVPLPAILTGGETKLLKASCTGSHCRHTLSGEAAIQAEDQGSCEV